MQSIVALSTAVGKGAVAIVRISGDDAITIASRITSPMPKQPNYLKCARVTTPYFVEQAMCVYFNAPHSYTGENMVELHCHGGMAIVEGVISTLIDNGCRMAFNGEFSKRAFINGKQNLANAEGIIQMIDADTLLAVKAGSNLLENKLGKFTTAIQNQLTDIISLLEVTLDYPEEELEIDNTKSIDNQLNSLLSDIDKLLSTVRAGRIIKQGIDIAIVGKPNVGKSSLLNALLGKERAIVSNIAGTTRDTISESIIYKNIQFNLIDTAGMRESDDTIEQLGVKRTEKAIDDADIVLHLMDDAETAPLSTQTKVVNVYTKGDINSYPNVNGLVISSETNQNITELLQTVYDMFYCGEINSNDIILTNTRHIDCLTRTRSCIVTALDELADNTLDCIAVQLNDAWQTLGEITGATASDDIINNIYSKFCLGK